MGAAGKAYTFVTKEQGDELTRIENTINMVIPVDTVEGFEHRPPPERGPMFPPKPEAMVTAESQKPPEPDKNSMRLGAKLPSRRRRR